MSKDDAIDIMKNSNLNKKVDCYKFFLIYIKQRKRLFIIKKKKKKKKSGVFFDISKAFDAVWHNGLISKLK